MRVTVCELSDNEQTFLEDWRALAVHMEENKPGLLLLPEMPFGKWLPVHEKPDLQEKMQAVAMHERWMPELEKLPAKRIVYSKPVIAGNKFYNTAYVFEKGTGHFKLHTKSIFPDEPHFWERTWFDAEQKNSFELMEINGVKIGVLLCTEMWFMHHARDYAKSGIDLLLCPRASGMASRDQWIRCGQTLSVISGAYCLSSNRSGLGEYDFHWGGAGWITEPITGNLIGLTNNQERFITRDIDINSSRVAKTEYPVYVIDK